MSRSNTPTLEGGAAPPRSNSRGAQMVAASRMRMPTTGTEPAAAAAAASNHASTQAAASTSAVAAQPSGHSRTTSSRSRRSLEKGVHQPPPRQQLEHLANVASVVRLPEEKFARPSTDVGATPATSFAAGAGVAARSAVGHARKRKAAVLTSKAPVPFGLSPMSILAAAPSHASTTTPKHRPSSLVGDSPPGLFESASYRDRREPLAAHAASFASAAAAAAASATPSIGGPSTAASTAHGSTIDEAAEETEDDDEQMHEGEEEEEEEDDEEADEEYTDAGGSTPGKSAISESRKKRAKYHGRRVPLEATEGADDEEDEEEDGETAMERDMKDEDASIGGESRRSGGGGASGSYGYGSGLFGSGLGVKQEPMSFAPLNHHPWMAAFFHAGNLPVGAGSCCCGGAERPTTAVEQQPAVKREEATEDAASVSIPPSVTPSAAASAARSKFPPTLRHALTRATFRRACQAQWAYSPMQSWMLRGHVGCLPHLPSSALGGAPLSVELPTPAALPLPPADSFSAQLSAHLGVPLSALPVRMTRREWNAARRAIGVPRRLSSAWLAGERRRLRSEVDKLRATQCRQLQQQMVEREARGSSSSSAGVADAGGKIGSGGGRRKSSVTAPLMESSAAPSTAPLPPDTPSLLPLGTVVFAPHSRGQLAPARVIHARVAKANPATAAATGGSSSGGDSTHTLMLVYVVQFLDAPRTVTSLVPEEQIVLAPPASQVPLSLAQLHQLELLRESASSTAAAASSSSHESVVPSAANTPFLQSEGDRSLLARLLQLIDRKKLLLEHPRRQNDTHAWMQAQVPGSASASSSSSSSSSEAAAAAADPQNGALRTPGASSAASSASMIYEAAPSSRATEEGARIEAPAAAAAAAEGEALAHPPTAMATAAVPMTPAAEEDRMEIDSVPVARVEPAAVVAESSSVLLSPSAHPLADDAAAGAVGGGGDAAAGPAVFSLDPSQLAVAWSLFQKQYAYTVLQLEATSAEMECVQLQLRSRKAQARRSTAALLNSHATTSAFASAGATGGSSALTPSVRAFLRSHHHSTDGPESLADLLGEARAQVRVVVRDLVQTKQIARNSLGTTTSEGANGQVASGTPVQELVAHCLSLVLLLHRCSDEGRAPVAAHFDALLRQLKPKHRAHEAAYADICESVTAIYEQFKRAGDTRP